MRTPTEAQLTKLLHRAAYDPEKAHAYYEANKQLQGRTSGKGEEPSSTRSARQMIENDPKAQQSKALIAEIGRLEEGLRKLETLIKTRETEEESENRQLKAKKERAVKEKDNPKTAAAKAEVARGNKKLQELKHGDQTASSSKKRSVSELKALATRVRGQIAVAKQKLAAL